MSDIERRLREIDREAFFPATPDLAIPVLDRIAEVPRPSRVDRRRWTSILRARPALAIFLAIAGAGGALLAASPSARSAILDLLGIEGATIERGETGSARQTPPKLGRTVSLAEARRAAGFELAIPPLPGLGRPSRIGFDRSVAPGGQVAFVWAPRTTNGAQPAVVLTQVRATARPIVAKTAPDGTLVERVEIRGRPGYWLAGAPHRFELLAPGGRARLGTARLAGDTLLWEHGELLLRLEGAGSKARALEIARSIPART
jgi:hypothetical protein